LYFPMPSCQEKTEKRKKASSGPEFQWVRGRKKTKHDAAKTSKEDHTKKKRPKRKKKT